MGMRLSAKRFCLRAPQARNDNESGDFPQIGCDVGPAEDLCLFRRLSEAVTEEIVGAQRDGGHAGGCDAQHHDHQPPHNLIIVVRCHVHLRRSGRPTSSRRSASALLAWQRPLVVWRKAYRAHRACAPSAFSFSKLAVLALVELEHAIEHDEERDVVAHGQLLDALFRAVRDLEVELRERIAAA